MTTLRFHLNGQPVEFEPESRTLLVDLLRYHAGLTGTHVGCDTSQCGCCTVMVDGKSAKSCTMLALQVQDSEVLTVEGLSSNGALSAVQEAFVGAHGLQCGFCTPGMIMAATCLLDTNPEPTDAQIVEGLEGNICRCTGYVNITRAVRAAASALALQKR